MSQVGYSRVHRAFEVSAILGVGAFSVALGWRLWQMVSGEAGWALVAGAAVASYLLADFVSGMVHWLADRYGTEATPVLGKNFIGPFRYHHVDPEDITRHDFVETNGNNCIVTLPVMAAAWWAIPARPGEGWALLATAMVLFFSLSIFATNQFHKWAHMQEPPALARALQRLHLILPHDHHRIHHTSPFDTYYCITTGWLNWPLQKLRFHERSERLIRALLGRWGRVSANVAGPVAEAESRQA